MSESQIYQLASAVSDLAYEGETNNINTGFYGDAVRFAHDPTVDDFMDEELDYVVIDPSVVLEAYANTKWEADFGVADPKIFEAMEEIYGTDLGYHWSLDEGPDDQALGSFHDSVEPEEVMQSLGDIKAEIRYPDHMSDCINGKRKELKRKMRNNDLEYGSSSISEVRKDIDEIYGQLLTGIKQAGDQIPVMRNSGFFVNYSDANFSNKDFTEDDLIEREAKELDGNIAIATFDAGFLDRDVLGLPPQVLSQMWG